MFTQGRKLDKFSLTCGTEETGSAICEAEEAGAACSAASSISTWCILKWGVICKRSELLVFNCVSIPLPMQNANLKMRFQQSTYILIQNRWEQGLHVLRTKKSQLYYAGGVWSTIWAGLSKPLPNARAHYENTKEKQALAWRRKAATQKTVIEHKTSKAWLCMMRKLLGEHNVWESAIWLF